MANFLVEMAMLPPTLLEDTLHSVFLKHPNVSADEVSEWPAEKMLAEAGVEPAQIARMADRLANEVAELRALQQQWTRGIVERARNDGLTEVYVVVGRLSLADPTQGHLVLLGGPDVNLLRAIFDRLAGNSQAVAEVLRFRVGYAA